MFFRNIIKYENFYSYRMKEIYKLIKDHDSKNSKFSDEKIHNHILESIEIHNKALKYKNYSSKMIFKIVILISFTVFSNSLMKHTINAFFSSLYYC